MNFHTGTYFLQPGLEEIDLPTMTHGAQHPYFSKKAWHIQLQWAQSYSTKKTEAYDWPQNNCFCYSPLLYETLIVPDLAPSLDVFDWTWESGSIEVQPPASALASLPYFTSDITSNLRLLEQVLTRIWGSWRWFWFDKSHDMVVIDREAVSVLHFRTCWTCFLLGTKSSWFSDMILCWRPNLYSEVPQAMDQHVMYIIVYIY